jgi:hypothetical protein
MSLDSKPKIFLFIRRLMPNASAAELEEASHNFERYMAVVARIHKRMLADRGQHDSRDLSDCGRVTNKSAL